MASRIQLDEPVVVDRQHANRRHDALVTTLQTYKGTTCIDVRKHAMGRDGVLKPTAKGITLNITKLFVLQKAIAKAVNKARELGLLDEACE